MLWLEELQNRKKISRIYNIYAQTFPEEERRSKEQFLALAKKADAYIFSINDEDLRAGYCVIWELNNAHFLEHFEVFEEFRNRNLGSQILEIFNEKYPKLILESEPANLSEIATRRISFYERNGFSIIDENYTQPSYGEGKPSINLWLMANYTPENKTALIKDLYAVVYDQN
ncbi:MAG: GNAT family N-acetyltransferase [Cruoricaptor ignavus]|nr:GNAT family N-acetyltransferase [Cruoricaptor ignavus]MDO5616542.1 GNAT family N-acetyltransferase [Cruoricaptor ignavus]